MSASRSGFDSPAGNARRMSSSRSSQMGQQNQFMSPQSTQLQQPQQLQQQPLQPQQPQQTSQSNQMGNNQNIPNLIGMSYDDFTAGRGTRGQIGQLGAIPYFPANTPNLQNGSFGHGLILNNQLLQRIGPAGLQRTNDRSQIEQFILPNGKLPFQTIGPVVSTPSQLLQSTDTLPFNPPPPIDTDATLIGTVGGIPLRPTFKSFESIVGSHVLLDVPEAGMRIAQYHRPESHLGPEGQQIPFVRHHFPPFDPIINQVISTGNERQELLILARQAESAERFHDMALIARQLAVLTHGRLSREERTTFLVAHKRVLLPLRQTMRCLKQPYQSQTTIEIVERYSKQIEYELRTFCKSLIEFVLTMILKSTLLSAENHVLFLKLIGDCYRYIAELRPLVDFDACRLCRSYYHDAALLAERYLSITSPIRLGLLLNYSVAAFELFRDYKTACEMIKCAFDKAITRLDELDDEDYRDSTLLLQLMRDNLTLWIVMQQPFHKNTQTPVVLTSAYDIQSLRSQPTRYPIELAVNNGNSFMLPKVTHSV